MAIYRDSDDVVVRDGSNVVSNLIWAVVVFGIIGAILWTVFFSGAFDKVVPEKKVDINVTAPAR